MDLESIQWRNEHFKPRMMLFSVGNGAMNALQYWLATAQRVHVLPTQARDTEFQYLRGRLSHVMYFFMNYWTTYCVLTV